MQDSHRYEKVSVQDDGGAADRSEGLLNPGGNVPTATTTPVFQVVAPATLSEGYEFEADLGHNRTIRVKVPQGGVEQGQAFSVPMPDEMHNRVTEGIRIPVGHWRDGLCSCCAYGACHPHCWTSTCPLVAAGQVQSRMKLRWNGQHSEATGAGSTGAFHIFVAFTAIYWMLYFLLYILEVVLVADAINEIDSQKPGWQDEATEDIDEAQSLDHVRGFFALGYWVLCAVILYNTRVSVRAKYGIPTKLCTSGVESAAPVEGGRVEDCLLSSFCQCCVAGQMLRHTTEYDTYPSQCCTETGVPSYAPSIV